MALPVWLTSQITAAQAETEGDGTAWSAYATTDDGLVQIVGAHDRDHAQRALDESGRTGIVASSRRVRTTLAAIGAIAVLALTGCHAYDDGYDDGSYGYRHSTVVHHVHVVHHVYVVHHYR